jgi:hypothetical protein
MFFAKYREAAGFKIAIDGVFNVPKDRPYIVYYTLNPESPHYQDPDATESKLIPLTSKALELNAKMDWNRPLGLVKFLEQWKYYENINYDPFLHMIVEVKEIKPRDDGGFDMKDFAWTVIPIFHKGGYVVNGHFQIPLFKGEYPAQKLRMELRNNDPWNYVDQLRRDKKNEIKYANNATVMFRLLDTQLEVYS